ncbi:hypothetical protein ACNKHL_25525 [Shigella flexneri]
MLRRFVTDRANVDSPMRGRKMRLNAGTRLGATAVFTDSADRDAVIDVVRKSGALDILVVTAGIGVLARPLN